VSWSRRDFVRGAALGGAALAMSAKTIGAKAQTEMQAVPRRKFERIDLEVPVMTVGTVPLTDFAPILRAMEWGINFVHTCSGYADGKAIEMVAKAMQEIDREDIVLGIKTRLEYDSVMRDLDVLGTDHVEIAFYHSTEPAEPGQEQVYEDFLRLKEAGAVKFLGLTSHGAVPEVMEAGLQTGWYDVLMPAYNPGNAAEVDPILERAAEQGVGGMVMKSLRGGGGEAEQVWGNMLAKKHWTTICWSVRTDGDVDKMAQFANDWERWVDAETEVALALAAEGRVCASCGSCDRLCPQRVAVSDILRYEMYAAEYGWVRRGKKLYASLPPSRSALACTDCGACVAGCHAHLNIPARLRVAHRVLS
jgi:predicted aldo/keto reductase-like oxidoreductase